MAPELALMPALIACSVALIFQMMPGAGPRFLFHVPVTPDFRSGEGGRSLIRRFSFLNWALAALVGLGGALGFWLRSAPMIVAWPLVHAAAGIVLYQYFRSQVAPFAVERPPRTGTLPEPAEEPILPWWGWLLMFLPLILLAGSAAYLQAHWDQIPQRFAVHFGIDGKPDRWAAKSFQGVFGPLLIGLSTMVLIYGIGAMTALGVPRLGPATSRLIRVTMLALAGGGIFAAGLVSWIALRPLTTDPNQMPNPVWIIALSTLGAVALVVALSKVSGAAEEEGAAAPEEGWWLSSVYYNPADRAMMVQRRIGWGFTPNLAHPVVKLALPLMLAQMFAVIYYVAKRQ